MPTSASPVTDQQLVRRVLQGDSAAFGEVVQRTEGLVRQIVYKMVRAPADRPDLVQEVYLKAYDKLAFFRFEAKLSTWLGQIAYNTCLHYLQKRRLVLLEEPDYLSGAAPLPANLVEAPTIEAVLNGQDWQQLLETALARLSPLYQTLLSLYYQQEVSYAELARITGLPDGTLKSHLFRARQQLRQLLLPYRQPEQ